MGVEGRGGVQGGGGGGAGDLVGVGRSRWSSRRKRRRMNIFWLCLRSLWSSRKKEEDEQMIWRVLEVKVEFEKEGGR